MRTLTADTKIRIKAPRRELAGDTRIRMSQIKDFRNWCGYLKDAKEWDESKHPRGHEGNAGQFSKTYCGNLKENQKDLQRTFDEANIPDDEKQAITNFSSGMSKEINAYQRNENAERNPILDEQIELIDQALSRTTLNKNIKTYRTIIANKEALSNILNIPGLDKIEDVEIQEYINERLKQGNIRTHDNAYLSTTIDRCYKHKKRRGKQKETKYEIRYQINAPKEAHGLYIESITAYPKQNEVLLFKENNLDLIKIKFNVSSKTFFINADLVTGEKNDT